MSSEYTPLEVSPWLQKNINQDAAEKSLTQFLSAQHEIHKLSGFKPLKVTEKSWVFSANVNCERVVIKRFFGANADHTVRSLKGELDYLATVLTGPKYRANTCIFAWPDDGTVVLSFVPGPRLGDKISAAQGQQRQELLRQSGGWLERYTRSRQRAKTFGSGFWIKQLLKKDLGHIQLKQDLELLDLLVEALRFQNDRIKGCPVVQAATHGDFVGINTHFHAGTIYGVDIQGECWLPVAKDAARFLVWLQIHDPGRPSERRSGIASADWDAFLASGLLSEAETKTTLPFFIGEQFFGRFVESYHRSDIRENTRSAIESYLNDDAI